MERIERALRMTPGGLVVVLRADHVLAMCAARGLNVMQLAERRGHLIADGPCRPDREAGQTSSAVGRLGPGADIYARRSRPDGPVALRGDRPWE